MHDVVEVVRATGALEATREAAQVQAERAKAALAKLPESEYKEALLHLAFDSINRHA